MRVLRYLCSWTLLPQQLRYRTGMLNTARGPEFSQGSFPHSDLLLTKPCPDKSRICITEPSEVSSFALRQYQARKGSTISALINLIWNGERIRWRKFLPCCINALPLPPYTCWQAGRHITLHREDVSGWRVKAIWQDAKKKKVFFISSRHQIEPSDTLTFSLLCMKMPRQQQHSSPSFPSCTLPDR